MLALDTQAQARWREQQNREKFRQQRQTALDQEIRSNTISVEGDAGRDTSSLLAQMGRPLASAEVQRRLHLCNPHLIFERAIRYPELTGIYFNFAERNLTGGFTTRKVHICGMESGIMPEFSVLHKTTTRVPNPDLIGATGGQFVSRETAVWKEVPTFYAETRGWRTVLLRLLKAKLITRADVEREFGWTPSHDSRKWQEQT